MTDPACFIEPFGFCIAQANAISGAIVAALASIVTCGWKLWSDRRLLKNSQTFESSERAKRQEFEVRERDARQAFEAIQTKASVEAQARIQRELESYIQLEEWRKESWQRTLARLELATQHLSHATSGLVSLVEEGPHFGDLRMVKETARVLDIFGDFQTAVSHFSLPEEISRTSEEVISNFTTVLLTLSPLQATRQSEERQTMLRPLKDKAIKISKRFMDLCASFERNPSAFLPKDV